MAWEQVIFEYDGTFNGFLCCVFESYTHRERPIAFYGDGVCLSLYPVRAVTTNPQHARRVYRSLTTRSTAAADMVRKGYLTCMEDKEMHLYALIRKLYRRGPAFLANQSDPACLPVAAALRHLGGELEKLRGFIRFSEYNGVLGAEIEPKNHVLPLLRHHFCDRYANESFFLYDRTHQEMLLYSGGRSRILLVDHLHLALPDSEELRYRALWKAFHRTVSIEERENPRCQNTNMPKRYRGTMTEFLPLDYEAQQRPIPPGEAPAALSGRAAPDEKSAPGIPE